MINRYVIIDMREKDRCYWLEKEYGEVKIIHGWYLRSYIDPLPKDNLMHIVTPIVASVVVRHVTSEQIFFDINELMPIYEKLQNKGFGKIDEEKYIV